MVATKLSPPSLPKRCQAHQKPSFQLTTHRFRQSNWGNCIECTRKKEEVVKDNKKEVLLEDTDRKRKIEEEDSPADSGLRKAQRIGDSAQDTEVGTVINFKALTFTYHPGFSMDREQFKEAIEANCRHDQKIKKEFEGFCKAFCYILLDPKILGEDVENLEIGTFLGSIFYVGKGSSSRPLQHFKDVLKARRKDATKLLRCPKISKIDELWKEGLGVPKHEFFHGCSQDEAYVREACMIFMQPGTWKGSTVPWDEPTKYCFGYSSTSRTWKLLTIPGSCKSFCYLLMDPRFLGTDVDSLTMGQFLSSIFYIGKGTSNRPLQHLIDARDARKNDPQKIGELWSLVFGVAKQEFFHGCSHDEALVREACMIFVLQKIQGNQLANIKPGSMKGSTSKGWTNKVFLRILAPRKSARHSEDRRHSTRLRKQSSESKLKEAFHYKNRL